MAIFSLVFSLGAGIIKKVLKITRKKKSKYNSTKNNKKLKEETQQNCNAG